MNYQFRCKVTANLLMLGPAGDQVLRAMGLVPAAQGIILPEAMPVAIGAVEAAIRQDESADVAGRFAADGSVEPVAGDEDVSLRLRSWPLLEMMRQAHAAGEPIIWGV